MIFRTPAYLITYWLYTSIQVLFDSPNEHPECATASRYYSLQYHVHTFLLVGIISYSFPIPTNHHRREKQSRPSDSLGRAITPPPPLAPPPRRTDIAGPWPWTVPLLPLCPPGPPRRPPPQGLEQRQKCVAV